MKNFLIFLLLIFGGLFSAIVLKKNSDSGKDTRPVLKVFAASSFISQWGPGPWLKEAFEKTCECRVEFQDGADSTILLQRLKSEGRTGGADVVLGFDQYDLELAQQGIEWRKLSLEDVDFDERVRSVLVRSPLVPYDWSLLSFVVRKSDFSVLPKKLDDLMKPELRGQIVMEDPRTSSPGLQFLLWLIQLKGEEKAFQFLAAFNQQLHSYAPSWSTAYGLFQKAQVKTTFSYVTSPVYHLVEDKSTDVIALEMAEGHPAQFEFGGVPATCRNCELAERFLALVLSKEGQKVIMEKNYMFPVVNGVQEGTVFASIPKYKMTELSVIPSVSDRERILKKWAALRRGE
ncbi:MAG: thiamine ABC transporter substrate-binding protein [Pseudobdellovibrionaceae bacterium]